MIDFLRSCPPTLLFGIILILINFPVGWIGLVWFAHLAKRSGRKIFYFVGLAIYVVSWILMLAGVLFCGKAYADAVFHKYYVIIIAITLASIVSLIFMQRYFAKKNSKINKKTD
ncbi:MAG: hypothetical protein FWC57_06585 [Endomicrobia bacterium]|nr:hypothetical protein [Endomicrobiia bacterium]